MGAARRFGSVAGAEPFFSNLSNMISALSPAAGAPRAQTDPHSAERHGAFPAGRALAQPNIFASFFGFVLVPEGLREAESSALRGFADEEVDGTRRRSAFGVAGGC